MLLARVQTSRADWEVATQLSPHAGPGRTLRHLWATQLGEPKPPSRGRSRSLCRLPLAVRGVRRCKGRVIAAGSEEVGRGDRDAWWAVGDKDALVEVVGKGAVRDRRWSVPHQQSATVGVRELPVTMLWLICIGPPPAKMPPPSHAALLARTME